MTPLVSVVLPTRNRARSIARSIETVLDQTFTDFELIVVFIRLSDRYDFIRSREALVVYARTNQSDRISNDRQALVEARLRLLAKYRDRLRQQPSHLAMQYFHIAVAAWASGSWGQTARFLARALATSPVPPVQAALYALSQWMSTTSSRS
jgi:hypothetical protein